MTQAHFYQLSEQDATPDVSLNASPIEVLACDLVAKCYSEKKRLTVLCANQAAAEAFSELLWQHPPERFIAHNLVGEGPNGGAPVEVTWAKQTALRSIVVNLAGEQIDNPSRYHTIYDFVPVAEADKIAARTRYAFCKQVGCNMQFFPASVLTNNE